MFINVGLVDISSNISQRAIQNKAVIILSKKLFYLFQILGVYNLKRVFSET